MKFDLETEKIVTPKCFFESSASQSVEAEMNLPDYCSDIKRILKCFLLPGINSVQRSGDRVSAEGEILIRLVYVNDSEKIDSYEQSVPLSRFVDVQSMPENACVRVVPKLEYVNCRAASQRRFTVSGSVSLKFRIYAENEEELPLAVNDETVEVKIEKFPAVCSCAVGEKTFEMSETVELGSDRTAVGRLICHEAVPILQSVKAVSGKLLIKGELRVKILYAGDSDERAPEKIVHSMPISQIIEIPNLKEDGTNNVSLSVRNLVVVPKSDSSGACRLAEIAAKLSAFVTGTCERERAVITDCYCTKFEMKPEYKTVEFLSLVHTLERRLSVKTSVDLSGYQIGSIQDVRCAGASCTLGAQDGRLSGRGSAVLEILFTDSDGKIQFAERSADFGFEDSAAVPLSKIQCEPWLTVENLSYTQGTGGKIEVTIEAYVLADVFSVTPKRVLLSAEADEKNEKPPCGCALTVCFCDKGESLWDIAKRYNTRVDFVTEENGISGGELAKDMMLMIPSA